MTPNRWQQIKALFLETMDQPPEQQSLFLEKKCQGDEDLRHHVEALLAGQQAPPAILEQSAAEALALTDEAFLDTNIGPYRLLRLLGRGGMGSVYLAERADGRFQQTAAIKVVRRGLDTDDILSRFRYERQILAALDHPHIASLYDGGMTEDGRPYFVMEYVAGEPITTYCDRKRLSTHQRLSLFRTVCRAVQYAHQNLIIHRDLKPSNILVTDDGTVKLLDFGIAKLITEDAPSGIGTVPHTHTGLRLMTPEYAAPEQVRGETVTTATDSYQLGVLLYELLTGQRPYQIQRRVQQEIERIILEEEPTRPSTALASTDATISEVRGTTRERLRRQLSGDLDTIVLKALAKATERRYTTVDQLAEDIRRYLAGLPVVAQRDTVGYRLHKFIQRHRFGATAGVLVALALLLGMTGTLWQAQIAAAERDKAQAEASKATKTADFLVNLFEAASPDEAQGRNITARELLATGEDNITRDLADQPTVRAQMLLVMGRVYLQMGAFEQATALMQNALALRRAEDASAPEIAEAFYHLANVYEETAHYVQSDSAIQNALQLQRQTYGETHESIANSLELLASLRWKQGENEEAETLFREALAMQQATLGPDSYESLVTMNNLAILLEQEGNFDEARELYETSLRTGIAQTGPDHPGALKTEMSLGHLEHVQDHLEAADSIYQRVLPRARRVLGEDHPDLAFMLNMYASLTHDRGDLDAAEQMYQEAAAIYENHFDASHPYRSHVLNNMAFLYVERKDYDGAQAIFEEILQQRRAQWPEGHADVALVAHNLGSLLYMKGELSASETYLREALTMYTSELGADHHRTARTQLRLGKCLADQHQYAEAEPLMLAAFDTFKTVFGIENAETQSALTYIIGFYDTSGHPEKATPYQDQLVE